MRELHVVAVSEDGRHVVLAASKGATKGAYRIRLDARLLAAVRGELGADTGHDLSPKEIQARLRAGESAEQIATSAGMALSRVERFAGPVAGEMARTIDQAREAFVVRGRLGRSDVPLGSVIDAALADHARPDTVAWTTRREEDGRWRVQVTWTARGRAREAAWFYDPQTRALEAVDPASAALGHHDPHPAPVRRAARKPVDQAAPVKAKPAGAKAKTGTVKTVKTVTTVKTAKVAATPAKVASATTSKAAPAKAKPEKAKPAKAKAAPAKTKPGAAKRKAPSKPSRPRLSVVPDPPAPTPRRRSSADEREGVKARASVPGWADVLLGTTPSGEK